MRKIILLLSSIVLIICGCNNTVEDLSAGDPVVPEELVVEEIEEHEEVDTIIARHNGIEYVIRSGEHEFDDALIGRENGKETIIFKYLPESKYGFMFECSKCIKDGFFFSTSIGANDPSYYGIWYVDYKNPYRVKCVLEPSDEVGEREASEVIFLDNVMKFTIPYIISDNGCKAEWERDYKEYEIPYYDEDGKVNNSVWIGNLDKTTSRSIHSTQSQQSAPWGYNEDGIPYPSKADAMVAKKLDEFEKARQAFLSTGDYWEMSLNLQRMTSAINDAYSWSRQTGDARVIEAILQLKIQTENIRL